MSLREFAIVHYHEIGLKGGNRSFFERALQRNLDRAMGDVAAGPAKRLPGRMLVPLANDADVEEARQRLSRVYGVANFAFAAGDRMTLEQIFEVAWARAQRRDDWATFAVRARKAHSPLPLSARELNEKIGAYLLERSGKRVNLTEPDLTVHVEIVGEMVFVYAARHPGPGGLPVGVSGRTATLLSAGIDSPVAAARMMQRGARSVFVHFHSMPFTDGSSVRQAEELAQMLTRFQYQSTLWLVPLAPSQQAIVAACPQELRTLLYRRQMMRIACLIADREGAKALVTGDSLGQVASQTMENLAVVEDASTIPVLRPLIGRDKIEIIDEATRLGTFEVSSAPCQEACVLFEPKRPATKASIAGARAAEGGVDVHGLAQEAVAASETRTYRYPG